MENKAYELRKLQASDIFPMCKIISKIGISEFKDCLNSLDISGLLSEGNTSENENENENEKEDEKVKEIGVTVILDVANVVLANIPKIEQEIYSFLSGLSGLKKEEVKTLDMGTFARMIVDVFKKEEFADFIGVASGLFN